MRGQIGDRKAIEICAGNGAIGRALNIPHTISYIQTTPEMVAYYRLYGQCPIEPPSYLERLEANEVVDQYRSEVVLGFYVAQLYQPGDEWTPKIGSSEDEEE